MSGFLLYEKFNNYQYVREEDLEEIQNYICGNSWSPNQRYWYEEYNICTKLFFVCKWRKKRGFQPIAKKGETICDDILVNIFTEHKGCHCSSY